MALTESIDLSFVTGVYGEDTASILMSYITFYSFLMAAAFLSTVRLISSPIECWCPYPKMDSDELFEAVCNYTKYVCWSSKQYVIDHDEPIPSNLDEKAIVTKREINFYPFLPFIVLGLAFIIKMPNFLWKNLQAEEGLNIPKAVKMALNDDNDDEQSGKDVAHEMIFSLDKRLRGRRMLCDNPLIDVAVKSCTAAGLFPFAGRLGTYQTGLFLVTRLLAVAVTFLAFPYLGYLLQADFYWWGWRMLRAGWRDGGVEPFDLQVFPRETLCDFRVRQLQNVQQFTVQCVLPINMWSEKLFFVFWFWLQVLAIANLFSYQYWIRQLLYSPNRRAFVAKHLTIISRDITEKRDGSVTDFTFNYLNHDCILVLRVLENTVGSRFATIVVKQLWEEHQKPDLANEGATRLPSWD